MQVTLRGVNYPVENCSDELVMKLGAAMQGSMPASVADKEVCRLIKEAIPTIDTKLCRYRMLLHPDGMREEDSSKGLDADELAEIVGAITVSMLEHRIERLKELSDDKRAIAKINSLTEAIASAKQDIASLKLTILLGDSVEAIEAVKPPEPKRVTPKGFAPLPDPTLKISRVINNAQIVAVDADIAEQDLQSEIETLRQELAQIKGNK